MTFPRELDLVAAAAFPASESARLDGWLVRRTPPGRPRRVNSALPPAAPDGGGVDGIEAVERWYLDRSAVPYVQVTPAEEHAALDAALQARGWEPEAPTDVLTAPAAAVLRATAATRGQAPSMHALTPARLQLSAEEGRARATVVLQEAWALVLDVEVDVALRRRGLATALVRACAAAAGGRSLLLQVEVDNAPAQALYRAAGLTRSHGYHYRRSRRCSTSSSPIGSSGSTATGDQPSRS